MGALADEPELGVLLTSPEKDAEIGAALPEEGVKVTEQAEPLAIEQTPFVGKNAPGEVAVNAKLSPTTDPYAPETTAVQSKELPLEEQTTLVVVGALLTLSCAVQLPGL